MDQAPQTETKQRHGSKDYRHRERATEKGNMTNTTIHERKPKPKAKENPEKKNWRKTDRYWVPKTNSKDK